MGEIWCDRWEIVAVRMFDGDSHVSCLGCCSVGMVLVLVLVWCPEFELFVLRGGNIFSMGTGPLGVPIGSPRLGCRGRVCCP